MDAVAIGSILGIVVSIAIVVYLVFRIKYLINHTHSED